MHGLPLSNPLSAGSTPATPAVRLRLVPVMLLFLVGLLSGGGFGFALPVQAQGSDPVLAPNYVLTIQSGGISPDGSQVEVRLLVTNVGGATSQQSIAELAAFDNSEQPYIVGSTPLRALQGNNDSEQLTLRADVTQFEPGSREVFRVQIAALPGEPTITSTRQTTAVDIPLRPGGSPIIINPETTPAPPATGGGFEGIITVPGLNLTLDLNNRQQVLLLIGIGASTLLLVLLIVTLLRLLFRRTPDFKLLWQPPYATVPPLDPYSTAGIRQSWQPLAQNNLILAPPTPGTHQAIKLLLGTDGRYLSGWQLMAARLIQYDQYGRVTRSETLATGRMVRQLDLLIERSGKIPHDRLRRRVRPIARRLARDFTRKVTARSAMLPIALDLRFRGGHGEVNILFELHRCDGHYWQSVDRWQPEMMITGKTLLESYTYSLFGQMAGETQRQFRRRLPEDLAEMLVNMIGPRPPEVPAMISMPARSAGHTAPPTDARQTAVPGPGQAEGTPSTPVPGAPLTGTPTSPAARIIPGRTPAVFDDFDDEDGAD